MVTSMVSCILRKYFSMSVIMLTLYIEQVVFSDESKFVLFGSDKRKLYVCRRSGEALAEECVVQTVKHGGGNVMIWGCFARNGLGVMCRVDHRLDSEGYVALCHSCVKSSFQKIFKDRRMKGRWFQQDGAPCHTYAFVL
eukprot:GCRY01008771.1.p1 GENE.GCRY01008771.1~~GCRY01008771.1.p1  ORF type:complete len:139 (+),score=4.69 GCRY01008771.1:183-599(+)